MIYKLGSGILLVILILAGLPALMRLGDESASFALARAEECPLVAEALGTPLNWSTFAIVYGSSSSESARATASWRTSISGSKGFGIYKYQYDRRIKDVQFHGMLRVGTREFHLPSCTELTDLAGRDPDEVVKIAIKGEIAESNTDPLSVKQQCAADLFITRAGDEALLILTCNGKSVYNGKGTFQLTENRRKLSFLDQKGSAEDGTPKVSITGATDKPHLEGGVILLEIEDDTDKQVKILW